MKANATVTTATPDQVDYIISYRESSPDRKKALYYVTRLIHQAFPQLNIVVVEQDNSKKLIDSELPWCQVIFTYNDGLFNRGWSNNVGVNHSHRPFIVFADGDIFLDKADYQHCFDSLQVFDAVDPKKFYINNVDLQPQTAESPDYQFKDKRYGNTFAGGIFLIRRQSLLDIGMWDEAFEGWGGEDNAMEHVIRLYLRQCRLQLEVYHIDHQRSVFDSKAQPHYLANQARSNTICSVHGLPLLDYVEEKKRSKLGAMDKYQQDDQQLNQQLSQQHAQQLAHLLKRPPAAKPLKPQASINAPVTPGN
ncbi:MAG: hypothetical protein ACI8WB_003248 [Phenylobacterium sp.]|jgi:hypothetical protein